MTPEIVESQMARTLRRAHPPVVMTIEDVADVLGYDATKIEGFPPPLQRFDPDKRWNRRSVLDWARNNESEEARAARRRKKKKSNVTYLYRHFDADGKLLYVGISGSATARLKQHQAADWAEQIKTVTVEAYQDRVSADAAETAAIKAENPIYNKAKKAK